MRKILAFTFLFFLCCSCFIHKGNYSTGICRPKKANFKLSKTPFKPTEQLTFNAVYIEETKQRGYGFLSDGRLIYFHSDDGFELKEKNIVGKNWDNASAIGYWRTEKEKIRIEYFSCSNSGDYIEGNGKIKNDSLIFERDCATSNPFKSRKCPEKYILSSLKF
jgi:hypothetical protein